MSCPKRLYALLELLKRHSGGLKFPEIPRRHHNVLDIGLHDGLIETDSRKYDGGPVKAIAAGSSEAAQRLAAYRAAINPT